MKVFCLLDHSSNSCSGQGWARSLNCIQVFPTSPSTRATCAAFPGA